MPEIFVVLLVGLALAAVAFLIFGRPKWREELGDTADLDPKYRDGPTLRYGDGPRVEDLRKSVIQNLYDEKYPPRFTKRPAPSGAKITLTPRHLEHINIRRRQAGKPPLNANGFRTAIARQATAAEPRAVNSTSDWLAYLIGYAVLSSEHEQSRVACEHTIAIEPDAPFNGQGGRFGGAGATSSFDSPAIPDDPGKYGSSMTRGPALWIGRRVCGRRGGRWRGPGATAARSQRRRSRGLQPAPARSAGRAAGARARYTTA